MICGAKTRAGTPCKKSPLDGKVRCRLHGGLSLSGKDHWNYQHGKCTKEYRRKLALGKAEIRYLEGLALRLGMFDELM